jgi:hypothetical protein
VDGPYCRHSVRSSGRSSSRSSCQRPYPRGTAKVTARFHCNSAQEEVRPASPAGLRITVLSVLRSNG